MSEERENNHKTNAKQIVAAMFDSTFTSEGETWEQTVVQERIGEEPDMEIPQADKKGNYPSPHLEKLNNAWSKVLEKGGDPAEARQAMDEIIKEIDEQLDTMEMVEQEQEGVLEDEVNARIFEGFELHREAIEVMEKYFEDQNPVHVEEGLNMVQEATNILMDGFNEFRNKFLASLYISCPCCGKETFRGLEKCHECGNKLPYEVPEEVEVADTIATEEGMVGEEVYETTPNLEQIEDAVNAWKAREIGDEELKREILEVEGNFLGFRQDMEREKNQNLTKIKDEKEKEIALKLCNGTIEAINENLAALSNMKEYFDDHNPNHINVGLNQLETATTSIIQAYRTFEQLNQMSGQEQAQV
ncbi:MAG: hypothetical protein ACLFQV_06270 [Vulcanimicrobiota bacterium]